MKCSVCNTRIKVNYCEKCGQKYNHKRLSLKTLFSDVFSSLTDVEKNVFINIYNLVRFPKKVIENYFNGYRGHYYSPGRMLFYFITIAGISSLLLDNTLFGITFQSDGVLSESLAFAIVYFPVLSLSSYLTYRRYKKNYLEHIASTIYLISTFGIIILFIENIFIYFSISTTQNSNWIFVLTVFVLLWNSILFTTPSSVIKVILNFILEFLVLITIVLIAVLILYLTGNLSLN